MVRVRCTRAGLPALAFALSLAAAAGAAQTVLLDTFEDDPFGGAPNNPDIGSRISMTPLGDFSIVNGAVGKRVNIRDGFQNDGYQMGYAPTAPAVQAETSYVFRLFTGSWVGANAFVQSVSTSPPGAISVYWGNDSQIRLRVSIGAYDNTLATGYFFSPNTDYFVVLETDAPSDTMSLSVNGLPIYSSIPIGASIDDINALYFSSNFNTVGTTQVDSVRIRDNFDPCEETTPPDAQIDVPPSFSCVCNPVKIEGTAADLDDGLDHWLLEVQPSSSLVWTTIASSTSTVVGGPLAIWNAMLLPQGYYILRLTVTNECGQSSTDVRVVYLDQGFDTVEIDYPTNNLIVGGNVCIDGTVYDNCFDRYEVFTNPPSTVNLVNPNIPFINDPFAYWPTTLTPDGNYALTVRGFTVCDAFKSQTIELTVDNTPPTAKITSPENCDTVEGVVPIKGTASDLNFQSWALYYTGGAANTWVPIASGNTEVIDALLANWDTTSLIPCAYTLRLIVWDYSLIGCGSYYQYTEYYVSVIVGEPGGCCPGDMDGNGVVNFGDIDPFVAAIGTTCP